MPHPRPPLPLPRPYAYPLVRPVLRPLMPLDVHLWVARLDAVADHDRYAPMKRRVLLTDLVKIRRRLVEAGGWIERTQAGPVEMMDDGAPVQLSRTTSRMEEVREMIITIDECFKRYGVRVRA